ncbi:sigma 54 modulation protein/ribosomal protein S30EA [Thermobispora bispora DSM 43833]|uniref:Ribosome hibernation promoting factor n=1 Tax=Thermobispora bispora (strain ATCC 19993 / DSM 43833 / CBS 139.67 / JCM 10125 / KCTC 9307 / NBRC 14880 / R51) TaxID=469371 RepID=D6Y6C6_THEBD|nr:sigma 54 modulation protein/ribosomal protein S30EA [Thermobispora bispora DSM 43833]
MVDIIVKGRHTSVSDRFRELAVSKLTKLERYDSKLIRIDVEVSSENNRQSAQRERVELTVHSRGPVIRAEASAEDRFAALDIALDKLEERLRRLRDRRKSYHANLRRAPAPAPSAPPAEQPAESATAEAPPQWTEEQGQEADEESIVPIPMEGEGPLVVREKFHKAAPMTVDQALFEMELVGHDFYLFRDKDTGVPSVVYKRRGYNYGVLRLIEE